MRSLFSKLTGQPQRVEDPDFGKLTYMNGYWEGANIFPPTQSEVEYFVTADERGPSDANRQVFQTIRSNYTGLLTQAVTAISKVTGSTAKASELMISSLDIPSGDLNAATWEISFSGAGGTLFSVKYSGLGATGEVDASY